MFVLKCSREASWYWLIVDLETGEDIDRGFLIKSILCMKCTRGELLPASERKIISLIYV